MKELTHKTMIGTLEVSKPDSLSQVRWRHNVEELLRALLAANGVEANESAQGLTDITFTPDHVSKRRYPALHRNSMPYLIEFEFEYHRNPNLDFRLNSDSYEHYEDKPGDGSIGKVLFGLFVLATLFAIGFYTGGAVL